MPTRMEILTSVAEFILQETRSLFEDATGIPVDHNNVPDQLDALGLIDEVDSNSDVGRWMNACVGLLRYVHAMMRHSLETPVYMLSDMDLLDDEFGDI